MEKLNPGLRKLARDPSLITSGTITIRVFVQEGATGYMNDLLAVGIRATIPAERELLVTLSAADFPEAARRIASFPWATKIRRAS